MEEHVHEPALSPVPMPGAGAPTAEMIRFDEASAQFLNAHRKERRTITFADYGDPMILKKSHVPNGGLA